MKIYLIKNRLRINYLNRFLFLFITFFFFQTQLSQSQQVSLSNSRVTLRTAFTEIERQTEMSVDYNREIIDVNRTVSIPRKEGSLSEIMTALLQGTGCIYVVRENHIVISKAPITTQQNRKNVTGIIIDQQGDPIIGANIIEKGTTNGTVTDIDGNFSLQVEENAILQISYIGYLTQEINTRGRTTFQVNLKEDLQSLEELVVIGYGTMKKANLTGAVSTVNMEKVLGDRPVTSVGAALQGAIPGLYVSGNSTPGAARPLNIRGITSINGGGPLILVDNVPAQLDMLNPEDIETVTVLKDASSSAIYGARAAFGVVLITTKKAKKNTKMALNYHNNFAYSKATNKIEQASVSDIVDMYNEWSPGGTWFSNGQPFDLWREFIADYQQDPVGFESKAIQNGEYFNPKWGMYTPASGPGAGKYFYLKDNDPQNEMFDNFGFQQTHTVSATGGGDMISYRLALTYLDNDGPLKTNKDSYNRINSSSYVSADIASWITTAFDVRYSRSNRRTLEDTFGNRIYAERYYQFYPGADSWTSAADPTGPEYLNTSPLNYILHGNPDEIFSSNSRIFSRTILTPFDNFEGIFEYTFDERVGDKKSYPNSINMRSDQMMSNPYADPTYRVDKSIIRYNAVNAYASYSHTLADHHNLKLMGGFSQEQRYYELLWTSRKGMINEEVPSVTGGTGEILGGDAFTDFAIRSGFFRFNYDYAGRYLLEVNGRYDGSSKFPKTNRFGFFPSASIGWQVGQENFMSWTKNWLDEFKVRASFGEIGNQAIDDYQFMPEMSVRLRSGWIYDGRRPTTLNPPEMVRDNFTWERVSTLNIGSDISVLNNRLQMVAEWYQRDTKGMLGPGLEFPAIVGTNAPLQNVADLRTEGWELSLNWRDHIKDWGYSFGFNISNYTSYITKYNNDAGLFGEANQYYVGMKFGEIWGYQFERFYTVDDFEDTSSWNLKPGITSIKGVSPRPGDIMWKNISDETGENEINGGANNLSDPGDRSIIGNSTPKYQFGITAGVNYKGFDLSILSQGVGKRDIWRTGDMVFPMTNSTGNGTLFKHLVGNWIQVADAENGDFTITNPNAFYPRLYGQPSLNNLSSNARVSDRYLLNAAYLRVKNITLGYIIPHNIVNRIGLSRTKAFFSAENAFTFSKLPKGMDPERISWGYPFYATYSLGINITL